MGDRITQEQVEGWLDDVGLTYEPFPVDDDPRYEWALLVSGQTYQTLVAQRKAEFNYLFLQIGLAIAEEHLDALRKLDDYDRRLFLYDLRLALLGQAVGSSVEFEGGEDGEGQAAEHTPVPVQVTLGYNLLEEQITRASLLRRNHQMQTTAQIVSTMMQKLVHMGKWP